MAQFSQDDDQETSIWDNIATQLHDLIPTRNRNNDSTEAVIGTPPGIDSNQALIDNHVCHRRHHNSPQSNNDMMSDSHNDHYTNNVANNFNVPSRNQSQLTSQNMHTQMVGLPNLLNGLCDDANRMENSNNYIDTQNPNNLMDYTHHHSYNNYHVNSHNAPSYNQSQPISVNMDIDDVNRTESTINYNQPNINNNVNNQNHSESLQNNNTMMGCNQNSQIHHYSLNSAGTFNNAPYYNQSQPAPQNIGTQMLGTPSHVQTQQSDLDKIWSDFVNGIIDFGTINNNNWYSPQSNNDYINNDDAVSDDVPSYNESQEIPQAMDSDDESGIEYSPIGNQSQQELPAPIITIDLKDFLKDHYNYVQSSTINGCQNKSNIKFKKQYALSMDEEWDRDKQDILSFLESNDDNHSLLDYPKVIQQQNQHQIRNVIINQENDEDKKSMEYENQSPLQALFTNISLSKTAQSNSQSSVMPDTESFDPTAVNIIQQSINNVSASNLLMQPIRETQSQNHDHSLKESM